MKPEEMQASSQRKFKQITELLKLLQVHIEPKEKLSREGYLEKCIVFVDDEKYPPPPIEEPKPEEARPEIPDEKQHA